MVIPRKCTRQKQVKIELVSSTFCCTVERIKRDIDGKTVQNHSVYSVPLKQFCLDHGSRPKVLKSHSFDRRRQNVFQKYTSHKILPFLCGRLEASCHTNRSMRCLRLYTQRTRKKHWCMILKRIHLLMINSTANEFR